MSSPPCSSKEKRGWILLVLVAFIIRLIDLGHRAMSHDESLHAQYSWYLSNGLNYEHNPMMHGPLLFHLNGFLYSFLPGTDFVSLLIPAFWGTGCVALLFLFRRWFGIAGAFTGALLVCFEPTHLFYSRYLRNDITVSFFTLLMLWAILDYRETKKSRSLIWLGVGLGFQFVTKETCFILGTVFGFACVVLAMIETKKASFFVWAKSLLSHPFFHCAALLLLLALPFAGSLLHPLLGWDPLDNRTSSGQIRILGIAGGILTASILAGSVYFYFQKRLRAFAEAMGLFWILQILLYTTLLTNPAQGMASGVAGSLGYWLSQHEVNRGNPDPFFYVTLLLLYTPVLLLAGSLTLRWIKRPPVAYLWIFFLGNLFIYSWAGERMPWLLMHITLPLCLLSGIAISSLFASQGRRILKGLILLGCFQLLANSLRVNGPLSEGGSEPLMYAHAGPDIKTSLLLIEEHLQTNPGTSVLVDSDFSWPLAWYFREAGIGYIDIEESTIAENISVIIVSPGSEERYREEGWISRLRVDMITWPRPQYHRISLENLDNVIRNSKVRKKFFRYYLFRDQPEWGENEWPGPSRYVVMTR